MLRVTKLTTFAGRNLLCDYPAVAGELRLHLKLQGRTLDASGAARRVSRLLGERTITPFPAEPPRDGPRAAALLLAWLTVELLNRGAGDIKSFGIGQRQRGPLTALCGFQNDWLTARGMRLACEILADIFSEPGQPPNALAPSLQAKTRHFIALCRANHLGLYTRMLVRLAESRGIPHYVIGPGYSYVQLGQGAKQRYIFQTTDDGESLIGGHLSGDKHLASYLLEKIGVPTPRTLRVNSLADAEATARHLGYPVVVKPAMGAEGAAVTVGVRDPRELSQAFRLAAVSGLGPVLLQPVVPGDDYRLLVIDGHLIAAAHRIPAHVVGDGKQNVTQLIEEKNRDPRRGEHEESGLKVLTVDAEAERVLRHQGVSLSTVPAPNRTVFLRANANLATGGSSVDALDRVHPEVREMAETVARAFRLKVAGIDYLTTDIGCSPRESGGTFIEVNTTPGPNPHFTPESTRSHVLNALVDRYFAPGDDGRVPTVGITRMGGTSIAARMVLSILQAAGKITGLACADGIFVGERMLHVVNKADVLNTRMLLMNPRVEAAVFEFTYRALITKGLPIDRCDVTAILNVGGDNIGERGMTSVEEMAAVNAILARSATRAVVLDANDPLCSAIAKAASAPICWTSETADDHLVRDHVAAGDLAVAWGGVNDQEIVALQRGKRPTTIIALREIPGTLDGTLRVKCRDALAAAAIGIALAISTEHIRAGLQVSH